MQWQKKLNQWKIWKIMSLCTFKVQKGHHTCPCRNVFKHRNIIMLECWNRTRDKVVWWWGNWTSWKFAFGKWNIGIGHYEKIRNGCHFVNMCHTEKFQITQPFKSLGLWFSECWNHGGVSNLEFCCMMIFHKIMVIFPFLHNGWCPFSIYIDTRERRDPVIWNSL